MLPPSDDGTLEKRTIIVGLLVAAIGMSALIYFILSELRLSPSFLKTSSTQALTQSPRVNHGQGQYLLTGQLRFEVPPPPLATRGTLRFEPFSCDLNLSARWYWAELPARVEDSGRFSVTFSSQRDSVREFLQFMRERGALRVQLCIDSVDGTRSFRGTRDLSFSPSARRIDFGDFFLRERVPLVGGRIEDQRGLPVARSTIQASLAHNGKLRRHSGRRIGSAVTDTNGRFQIFDLMNLTEQERLGPFDLEVERQTSRSRSDQLAFLGIPARFRARGGDLNLRLEIEAMGTLRVRFAATPGIRTSQLVARVHAATTSEAHPSPSLKLPLSEVNGGLQAEARVPTGSYTVTLELRDGTPLTAAHALIFPSEDKVETEAPVVIESRPLIILEIQDSLGRGIEGGQVRGKGLELISSRGSRHFLRARSSPKEAIVSAPQAPDRKIELQPGLNVILLPGRQSHEIHLEVEGFPELDEVTYMAQLSSADAPSIVEPARLIAPEMPLILPSELEGELALRFKARCVFDGITIFRPLDLEPLFFESRPGGLTKLKKRLTSTERDRLHRDLQRLTDD